MKIKLLINYYYHRFISLWWGLLIIGLIIPSILPLFRHDFFHMHDYTHVARLYEMDKAIKDGHFPMRWSKDLGWGYGMPLFNFYAPLPYYFAEIFHLLGFTFLDSIKICFGATFFIAFLGMFLLAKKLWGNLGGILSGLAFVYSPYRSVDFYVRGALGELFGISLIPLSIWAIWQLIEKRTPKKLVIATLAMACLFLSHTVLTLIVIPVMLFIATFFIIINKKRIKGCFYFITSFLLSLSLSSFFLLPAFFEKKFTQVNKLTEGFSYYGHHFLYWRQFLSGTWGYGGSVDSIPDGISFHLGKLHLLLAIITLLCSIVYFFTKKKIDKRGLTVLFFFFLGFGCAFLSTYKAKPIWDALPLMAYIQFPWRFNSFIIVFLGFLIGGSYYYLQKLNTKIAIIFLILLIGIFLKLNIRYFKPEAYIDSSLLYYTDETLIKKQMSGIIPDYIPLWVKLVPQIIPEKDYEIISGDPYVEVKESKTQKLALEISSQDKSRILLNRFYFPGWEASINNKKVSFDYQENNGIIGFNLPAGNLSLTLEFKPTKIRLISDIISLTSLLILGGIFVSRKKIS